MANYKNLNYFFNVGYFKGLNFIEDDDNDTEILKERNRDIRRFSLNELMAPIDEKIYSKDISTFTMETTYPGLLIGTGNIHGFGGKGEIALGFTFDFVTGAPYIPGSSVKGCLKKAFFHEEYILEILGSINKVEYTKDDVDFLKENIFGSDSEDCIAVSKRDIFFDAIIYKDFKNKSVMELDNITSHDKEGLKEPNPITMIKVKPSVKFTFQFLLNENKSEDHVLSVEDKKELFKNILMDLGIGAKTNTGYGYLD